MSARVVITGASGFAGAHLVDACVAAGDEVVSLTRSGSGPGGVAVDLLDAESTRRAVAAAAPEVVYHLAALAHVGRSWGDPGATLAQNHAMTFNVLEAVRAEAPSAAVIAVSSGEVYGVPASLPVDESAPLAPQNPYAVSKAAGDLLAGFYADAHGLCVARPRAFNHSGPRQPALYALASFSRQVAAGIEAGADPIRVVTGNPDARRDYTDVRDVIRAYRLLAAGRQVGVFNVCSGRSASAAELVTALGKAAGVAIEHVVDPKLVRAHEVMDVRGTSARLHAATGWAPEIPLETTLADSVAWWRAEIRAGRAPARVHE
jgi:GDP-4-dehydro-6-deoxy-D-mannose reductase